MRYLMLCVILFVLVSCGPNVKTRNDILLCPAPTKPNYQALDNATHLGSEKNIIFLMNDLNMMKLYMDGQNSTIECYIRQVQQQEKK